MDHFPKTLLPESELPTHWYNRSAYEAYLTGKLEDYEYPKEATCKSLEALPQVD